MKFVLFTLALLLTGCGGGGCDTCEPETPQAKIPADRCVKNPSACT